MPIRKMNQRLIRHLLPILPPRGGVWNKQRWIGAWTTGIEFQTLIRADSALQKERMSANRSDSISTDRAAQRATAIGGSAVLMWALLAPLVTLTKGVPPFELLALSFAAAFLFGTAWLVLTTKDWRALIARIRQPPGAMALSVTGLFGYHALYFIALDRAPPAEASLINYLWPVLIVLLSALAAREALRPAQLAGALLGFGGTALLLMQDDAANAHADRAVGYAAAFACAFVWSSYSVLNRRYRAIPSETMIGVCGIVAVLGLLSHLTFERVTVPPDWRQWSIVAALGIGPVGLAFLAWDHGTKHGHLALLGVLSYAAPVLSTLLLVALGRAPASLMLLAACVLVVGGALIASTRPTRKSGGPIPSEEAGT